MKQTLAIFLICVMLLCCASCVSNNPATQNTSLSQSQTTTTTTTTTTTSTTATVATGTTTKRVLQNPENPNDIVIYAIDRDDFQMFLKAPSYEFLAEKTEWTYSYLEDGDVFRRLYSCGYIDFEQQVIDFLTDSTAIQAYLADNQIQGTIERKAIFEAPDMPITMWVKTTKETVYITIGDPYETDMYHLYTQDEFNNQNLSRVGKLFYQGKEIDTPNSPIIYGNSADVPLIAILKAVGATIEEDDENIFLVHINGQTYVLDIQTKEMFPQGEEYQWDMLMVAGGIVFKYVVNDELMVSECIATTALGWVGVNAYVNVDTENARVVITDR